MATRRQTSPTTTVPNSPTGTSPATTVPAGGGGGDVSGAVATLQAAGIDPNLFLQGQQKSLPQSNPIGVPYYLTDPRTGEIAVDAQGNPIRWSAQVTAPVVSRIGGEAAGRISSTSVLPRYYQSDAEAILAGMAPEDLQDLQFKLVKLGLYGTKTPNITYGIPDSKTADVFSWVLQQANLTGSTFTDVIRRFSIPGALPPQPAEAAPSHVIQTTNTEDLVATFKAAARNTIGREISDDQARNMAAAYQGAEAAYQTAAYQQTDVAGQGVKMLQQPASPENFANAQLQQTNAPEYGATRAINQLETFRSILAGPFGGGK